MNVIEPFVIFKSGLNYIEFADKRFVFLIILKGAEFILAIDQVGGCPDA